MGTIEKFYRLKDLFQFSNVSLYKGTFQDFNTEAKFDVIVMHNSINHLNEQACMNLKFLKNAESEYAGYFNKLFDLADHRALLILSDCSNANFWDFIKIRNPFAENIEWNKHQSPEICNDLAQTSGFTFEELTWSTFNRLGKAEKTVLGNRFLSYFLDSHFNLYLTKE